MAGSQPSLKRFYLVILGVAVVGAVLLWWVTRPKGPTSIPIAVDIQPSDTAGFQGYVLGPDSAPVTVIEYADYQCPACQSFDLVQFPTVRERLVSTGRIRYIYRDYPLDSIHQWARLAAHAAACVDEQGKFWEFKDALYRSQTEWAFSRNAGTRFRETAGGLGVDLPAYDECMSSLRYAGRIQAGQTEGTRLGVNATPTFIIGGRLYQRLGTYDQMRAVVDSLSQNP